MAVEFRVQKSKEWGCQESNEQEILKHKKLKGLKSKEFRCEKSKQPHCRKFKELKILKSKEN